MNMIYLPIILAVLESLPKITSIVETAKASAANAKTEKARIEVEVRAFTQIMAILAQDV